MEVRVVLYVDETSQILGKGIRWEVEMRVQELLLGVLPLTKELLIENCSRYICELSCVKDIYKYYKFKANVEALKSSLVQRFEGGVEQRVKRCLPSDVEPQLSSAPKAKQIVTSNKHMKSVGHTLSQTTDV